jgi:hypothetical protein
MIIAITHFNDDSAKIFNAFLNASTLNEFVNEVARIIDNPVIVADNVFKVLAGSPTEKIDDESGDSRWNTDLQRRTDYADS